VALDGKLQVSNRMNNEQMNATWFGLVLFIAMGAYPPWVHSYAVKPDTQPSNQPVLTSQLVCDSIGYSWIWKPPGRPGGVRPDIARLSIQWVGLIAVFGLWIYALRTKPKPASSQSTAQRSNA